MNRELNLSTSTEAWSLPRIAHRGGLARLTARATLLLTGLACLLNTALAQPTPDAPPPAKLIALHYQDVLAAEEGIVDLFLPPPPLVEWNELSYQAEGCLVIEDVLTGPPDKAIVVRLAMAGPTACVARVDLVFSGKDGSWPAAAQVAVTRMPDVPRLEGIEVSEQDARAALPWNGTLERSHATMLAVRVANTLPVPITLVGLGNGQAFAELMGGAFVYDPAAFDGSYAHLQTRGVAVEGAVVAPGEAVHLGLVLDPERRLPTLAGTMTFRPVLLVEVEGELRTLPFPRASRAWGVGLP